MNKNKSLFVRFLPIIAFAISPLLNLAALPFITSSINPNSFGLYNYYISIINIVLLITLFPSLNSGILRFMNTKFESYTKDKLVITNLIFLSTLTYGLISTIIYFYYQDILFIYISVTFYFIFLMNFFKSFLNVNGYKIKFSLILLSTTLVQYSFVFIMFYFFSLNVYHLLLGNLLLSFFILIFQIIKSKGSLFKFNFNVNKKNYSKIFKFVIPSMVIAFAGVILSTGDRILIKNLLINGDFYVGIYSVNYTLYAQVIDLIVAIFYLYIPFYLYSKYENNGLDDYIIGLKSVLDKYIYLSTLAVALFMFNYDKINFLILDNSYLTNTKLAIYVLVGQYYFGIYRIISNYYLVINKQKITSILLIIIAVLNVALNLIFIPLYGYIAAAVTTLICFIILVILTYLSIYRSIKDHIISLPNVFIIMVPIILLFIVSYPDMYKDKFEVAFILIRDSLIIIFIYFIFSLIKIKNYLKEVLR
ncbi:hypothetical protein JMA_29360 [Jeotgalibacillus malaysiensis]|uniref:Uncharacterized protein n=1 Tax=Jeotgalibacillus malaysiensis TaxID=1508404 RepID=A0A0B5AUH0_9BACL|nr:polysaccharide biosynthesis C-terminal domain-containing protein [Jeotgalibacillus malaysiensis]AJD92253.1 hypothetical protein JMA_29360 [Jeotgalibacillus malaysiensis]